MALPTSPRIIATATAWAPYEFAQDVLVATFRDHALGSDWETRPESAERGHQIGRIFAAAGVEHRQTIVNVLEYHLTPHTTGERMVEYQRGAYALGREALEACLRTAGGTAAAAITDLIVVSCTGYRAPGLDLLLARDLGMPASVRRVVVGHMGCYGALVGLRQALATLRAYPDAVVALLCVELCSLHWTFTLDLEQLTCYALFGDAAAAVVLANQPDEKTLDPKPELVDAHCAAEFSGREQMSWTITDTGFLMGLSPRVPVTLRRNVRGIVGQLLDRHGLTMRDVTHWLVHPGGPDILRVIQQRLELSDEQLALSWQVLREHGNCSAPTVLLVLDALLRSGRPRRGEWGVMMAFGPGLTLETCLLRF
jgi:predicted naringenin-chalcone synthase